MNLYLEVQVKPTAKNPHETIEEAVALAERIGIPVRFNWRYVQVTAYPNDNVTALKQEFDKAAKCVGINTYATLHRGD